MAKVVVFGAGQTAEIVHDYLTHDSPHEIVAFTVDGEHRDRETFLGLPVVPFEEITERYPPGDFKAFTAISYQELNQLRARKYAAVKERGYDLISYVSSKCSICDTARIGDNCLVLEHITLQPYARVGSNVFLWSGSLVGHHAEVGDHCWVTSGASIAGNAKVGSGCFLGVNSSIGHMITIGRQSFVGAGARVTKSAKPESVFIEQDTELYRLNSAQFVRLTSMF